MQSKKPADEKRWPTNGCGFPHPICSRVWQMALLLTYPPHATRNATGPRGPGLGARAAGPGKEGARRAGEGLGPEAGLSRSQLLRRIFSIADRRFLDAHGQHSRDAV